MRAMVINRRRFLQLSAASLLLDSPFAQAGVTHGEPILASAYQLSDKTGYGVAVCDARGNVLQSAPLPSRGHDSVFRPHSDELITFARRPGTYLQVLSLKGEGPLLQVESVEGRHFYGHGCFDSTSRLLFSTENEFDQARGVIGVYDATANYQRVGEFDSYGVGPHEIVLHPDGVTLIVANGGIETHPDYGREKLNLADMRSSVAFIDSRDGRLIKRFEMPDAYQKLSLRHLAVNASGLCFFGAQYQGAVEDMPPLLGTVSMKEGIHLMPTDGRLHASLKSYIGSICTLPGTDLFVASASRGGVALLVDAKQYNVLQVLEGRDGSGVAASAEALFYSAGDGAFRSYAREGRALQSDISVPHARFHWDNHLSFKAT